MTHHPEYGPAGMDFERALELTSQERGELMLASWQLQRRMGIPPKLRILGSGEMVTQCAVNAPTAGSNPAFPATNDSAFERDLEVIRKVMERVV